MIIGVKLGIHGRSSGVFSFETNQLVNGDPLGLYFGKHSDEVLLHLSTMHFAAHKLEVMRYFMNGAVPRMTPISAFGTLPKASITRTIRVTNKALDCVGQYMYFPPEPLSDGSVNVDTIYGDCYNLFPTDYEVVV